MTVWIKTLGVRVRRIRQRAVVDSVVTDYSVS